ncbi:MAG TPA: fasciclin domain-containing protein [Pseudonocardiaceae bacterium]|nr:fasciclin domain-containing protein [Pseudonocardiaceae bacterium]
MRKIQRLAAVGAMAALTVAVGACSNPQGPTTGAQASAPVNESTAPAGEAMAPTATGVTQITDIFGPACGQVPTQGEGSAQGMVDDPVATAASNNPLLKTLVAAVTAAKLGDTLNSAEAITVFAPADPAFADLEAKNPGITKQLTTDPNVASADSKLSTILKYHVVGQRYDAAGLVQAGTVETLQGNKVTIAGTPAAPTVNGTPVLCGNIPTKNATVFVIGQVLSPPAT